MLVKYKNHNKEIIQERAEEAWFAKLIHHTGITKFGGCQCFKDCNCEDHFVPKDFNYYTVVRTLTNERGQRKTTHHDTYEEAIERWDFIMNLPSVKDKPKYRLLTCPSSDEENEFIELSYDGVNIDSFISVNEFTFTTQREMDIFIKGYLTGVGYLGDGSYKTKYQ